MKTFNPLVTNELYQPYHLAESIFLFMDIGSKFLFLFSMKIISANRIAPDGTPHFAASHLGLFCLPMSHKKDKKFIWVNPVSVRCLKYFSTPVIMRVNKYTCFGVPNFLAPPPHALRLYLVIVF